MQTVVSSNVAAVGYDKPSGVLRVQFKRGGTYEYFGVREALFEEMLLPHPWRRVGRQVKAHPNRKIA